MATTSFSARSAFGNAQDPQNPPTIHPSIADLRSTFPQPPTDASNLPDGPAFAALVSAKPVEWYKFFSDVTRCIEYITTRLEDVEDRHNATCDQAAIDDQELQALRQQVETLKRPTEAYKSKSEKIPDPSKFEGNQAQLRVFVTSLMNKLRINQDRFPTPQERVAYAFSLLEGRAQAQIIGYHNGSDWELADVVDLISILERAFGDPDRRATAQRSIRELKQANKDFASYYADFQRDIKDTGFDDTACRAILESGMSIELQRLLITTDTRSMSLQDFVHEAQRLDNRLRAFRSANPSADRAASSTARPFQSQPRAPPVQYTTPAATTIANLAPRVSSVPIGSDAMELDAARVSRLRAPLTDPEKQRRRTEGLCLYCGGKGHKVFECRAKPANQGRAVSAFAASLATAASTPSPSAANDLLDLSGN